MKTKKTAFFLLILLTVSINIKAQGPNFKLFKSSDFYHGFNLLFYTNKADISNLSDKIDIKSRNLGFAFNYKTGLLINKKIGIEAGIFAGTEPFNFRLKINDNESDFDYETDELHRNFNIPVGFSIKSFYLFRINNKLKLKIGGGYYSKYFLKNSINSGLSIGDVNTDLFIDLYKINLSFKTITEGSYQSFTISTGLLTNLRKENRKFFIDLVVNISLKNLTEGTIDFFGNRPYHEEGIYIQKGHFIGLRWGVMYFEKGE